MSEIIEDLKCPRCGHNLDSDNCATDNALAYGKNIYACPKCGKPYVFYRTAICKPLPETYSGKEDDWGRPIVNDRNYKPKK